MKKKMYLGALMFLFVSCSSVPETIYVSPSGDDRATGSKEHPFATIERAREEVRRIREEHPDQDVRVCLRGGVYRLKKTVVFTREDGAAPGHTVIYEACPGERPVLSGSVPVTSWVKLNEPVEGLPEKAFGHVWVADVSYVKSIKKDQLPPSTVADQQKEVQLFYTLYQGSERLPRARGKRFDFVRGEEEWDDPLRFAYPEGELASWPDLANAEMYVVPFPRRWISNMIPLKEVNERDHTACLAYPATYPLQPPARPYGWVENVLAVLDEPGEWVLDNRNSRLYLWPRGDRPDSVYVPVLTELVRVEGTIRYDSPEDLPVTGLVFHGITFTQGDRLPWHGETGWGLQHDWERFDSPTALLRFRGCRNCAVTACHFTTSGGSGVRFDLYAQENRVEGNEFDHLGGVGILFAGYGPGTKDVNRHNTIVNNSIHHTGTIYNGSPGLFIWQSGENRIENNLLYHLPYAGICVTGRIVWDTLGISECSRTIRWDEVGGKDVAKKFRTEQYRWHVPGTWYMREKWLHARNNRVWRNDIHHVMETLGDGNCIYVSGAGGGNQVIENYCHHCPSKHMNNAIRCDDDQNLTLIKRNIVFRTGGYAEAFLIKGKNDIIENLAVDLRTGSRHRGYLRFYDGVIDSSVIQYNVFYSCEKGQHPVGEGIERNGMKKPCLRYTFADYNVYWSTVDPEWGIRHLEEQRKYGIEMHSIAADPMFEDMEHENFHFRKGSPALKLGIHQPIDVKETGPRGKYRKRFYRMHGKNNDI